MIRSMTGYGRASGVYGEKQITVEIKTLNSKQLDFSIRQPAIYAEFEPEIRNMVTRLLERGKVYCNVQIEGGCPDTVNELNTDLAVAWLKQLRSLEDELNLKPQSDYLPLLVKMPDIFKTIRQSPDNDEQKTLMETVSEALEQVDAFRQKEGGELGKDISSRILGIKGMKGMIIPLEEARKIRIRERMMKSIGEAADFTKDPDSNRLEQEMIYYFEKIDITEEKIRLGNHLDYFLKVMEEPGNNGRKLGFIAQEIGREVNTLGSKAYDTEIQKIVVEMKDELEKIKEQLFNVL